MFLIDEAGDDGDDDKQMMTYAEAAKYLGVPRGTLHAWVHHRSIPHVRLGPRLVRFPRAALVKWLEARFVAATAARKSPR